MRLAALTAAVAVSFGVAAAGAATLLDQTFAGDGTASADFFGHTDGAFAAALQPDGKLVTAGYAEPSANRVAFGIARFRPDGSLDPEFSGDGLASFDFPGSREARAYGVAIQSDGRIVVVGYTSVGPPPAVIRLLPDGQLDPTFGGDGMVQFRFRRGTLVDGLNAVAIQPDGRIVVCGQSTASDGFDTRPAVARLNPDGTLDRTFSGDGGMLITLPELNLMRDAAASDLALQPDGGIVIGLSGFVPGDETSRRHHMGIARLTAGGRLDRAFSRDGITAVELRTYAETTAVAVQADGAILASSYSYGRDDRNVVARLNVSGRLDPSFSRDGRRTLVHVGADVAVEPGGKILLVGKARRDFAVARLQPSGALDREFWGGGEVRVPVEGARSSAFSVIPQPDGAILATGLTAGRQHELDMAVARVLPR